MVFIVFFHYVINLFTIDDWVIIFYINVINFTLQNISQLITIDDPIAIFINNLEHPDQIIASEHLGSLDRTSHKLSIIDKSIFVGIYCIHDTA